MNTVKVFFCDVTGCSIRVYNFILLKSSIKIFFILNIPNKGKLLTSWEIFDIIRKEWFIENKNKLRAFWGWKPSKNKNAEPHQNFTGSHKKVHLPGMRERNCFILLTLYHLLLGSSVLLLWIKKICGFEV